MTQYWSQQHLEVVRRHWEELQDTLSCGNITVNGKSLTIVQVVASSEHGCHSHLTDDAAVIHAIKENLKTLYELLDEGWTFYSVNTGVGGSADSLTDDYASLRTGILQCLQSGILIKADTAKATAFSSCSGQAMPNEWVKGAMVVRANSLSKAHSGVTLDCIKALLKLVSCDVTPVVPLRGSISASGDLMPLSYVPGVLEGNPGVFARCPDGQIRNGLEALKSAHLRSVTFGPKDAVELVNCTSSSAALASLVMYKAHHLALLAQVNTSLIVEALQGSIDSFHPFISAVCPHEGQTEAATNIRAALQGSCLAYTESGPGSEHIRDGYSVLTAIQWIAAQLEDLVLADHQVSIELNSSTDEPLIDTAGHTVHSGGHFQAASITSAMEKTRLSLQALGKLLFTQCSDVTSPSTNRGLPPNLASDDPSVSFTMKGIDISMAAYMSELEYLANPVSMHVQAAEGGNQPLNSLAFVSARYTMAAVDIFLMMSACSLYVSCQALDLRVLQLCFMKDVPGVIQHTTATAFRHDLDHDQVNKLSHDLTDSIKKSWATTSRMDLQERCKHVVGLCTPVLLDRLTNMSTTSRPPRGDILTVIAKWQEITAESLEASYSSTRQKFYREPPTAKF